MGIDYPSELIRGVANRDFLDNEGRASALLFQFEDTDRLDGFLESSICWLDNNDALIITMGQRRKDDATAYQFKIGVAVLSRAKLDNVIKSPNAKDAISYERRPTEGNPYHGNILIKSNIEKKTRTMIAGTIAMCTDKIIYRSEQ